jgi:hypothetical protein
MNGFEGIGPYAVPSRERINAAARQIVAQGGRVSGDIHRASAIDYAHDPPELRALRKHPAARQWSCGCGQPGVLAEIPATARPGSVASPSRRLKGPLHICIRCDAGHLMPKLTETAAA